MLYHVPDLSKALSEVKRVLKTGGNFYSSTISNEGMQPFLHEAFKHFNPDTTAFTQKFTFNLCNGFDLLSEYFSNVKRVDYEDSLAITETQDLIDWIKSVSTLESYTEQNFDDLFNYFETIRKKDGAINIPKESGLFISTK
jgi:ubiquinone/menaquinone biosynthesis C-methylase UbiE